MPKAGEIPPAEPTKVSLVVACRNESKHIRMFLDSLLGQDLEGLNWEVIIADGMSDDDTSEVLRDCVRGNSRVAVIDNPAGIVSAGLNAAIRAAQGEVILRMDAHTEYTSDYVKKCVQTLNETGAENVGGPARTKAEGLLARAIQAAYHSRFSTGGARFHDENYNGYVETVPYGCWRKTTLERLGLFDEQLVRNQDDELNLRLTRAGGRIWQSSKIVSRYRPRATISSLFRQYFQYGFWKVAVIRKHRIPASWRHLVPGCFVLANLVLLLTILCLAAVELRAWFSATLLVWAVLLVVYSSACLTAAFFSAWRRGWALLPYLPMVFAAFHISYGLGFLMGVIYWTLGRSTQVQPGKLFVGLTR